MIVTNYETGAARIASALRSGRQLLRFIPASHWLVFSSFALAGELLILLLLFRVVNLPPADVMTISTLEVFYVLVAFNFIRIHRPNPDLTDIALGASGEVVQEIHRLLPLIRGDDPESMRCSVRILRLILEHPSDDVLALVADYSRALTSRSRTKRIDTEIEEASNLQTLILTSLFDPSQNAAGSVFYGLAQRVLPNLDADEQTAETLVNAANRQLEADSNLARLSRASRRWIHRLLIDLIPSLFLVPLTLPLTGILASLCALAAGKRRYPMFTVSRLGSPSEFGYVRLNASVFETDRVRMSWVGQLLTWTGLDKLPAITGILRGELSFIGPEPLGSSYYAALYAYAVAVRGVPRERAETLVWSRLAVRPGLFGPSQLRAAIRGRFAGMNCLDYLIVDSRYALAGMSALWKDVGFFLIWPSVLGWRFLSYGFYLVRLSSVFARSPMITRLSVEQERQYLRGATSRGGSWESTQARRDRPYADSALLFFATRI